METTDKKQDNTVSIKVLPKGPLLVTGDFKLTLSDGVTVDHTKSTALCRCGGSKNKPYCDGSHNNVDFDK